MAHEYLNAFINNSDTIAEKAGAELKNARHKAVMYDSDGNVIIATSGDKAIGVVLSNTAETVEKGYDLHILIKQIGLVEAGGAIAKGDLVTVNSTGQVTKAASGEFIFGRAYTAAEVAEGLVQVQINHMGIMA